MAALKCKRSSEKKRFIINMSKFYLMLVILRAVKGSLAGLIGELVTVDGRSKIAVRLNILRCVGTNILAEYLELMGERQ